MDDLETLKRAWADLDGRVERLEHGNRRRRRVVFAGMGDVLQLVIAIATIAAVAQFWVAHRTTPHLLIAGLALHVYGIAVACATTIQLLLLVRLYYTRPVLEVQRRLARMQRFRARTSLMLGLPWWLLWVPAAMVLAQAFAGVDLYAGSPAWVWSSLGIGVVGLAVCLWLARRLVPRSPFARFLAGHSGRNVARAARELDALDEFGRE
ncbi:MAG: hypothetical protein ABI867_20040 [Kofleriaceae bacterium]